MINNKNKQKTFAIISTLIISCFLIGCSNKEYDDFVNTDIDNSLISTVNPTSTPDIKIEDAPSKMQTHQKIQIDGLIYNITFDVYDSDFFDGHTIYADDNYKILLFYTDENSYPSLTTPENIAIDLFSILPQYLGSEQFGFKNSECDIENVNYLKGEFIDPQNNNSHPMCAYYYPILDNKGIICAIGIDFTNGNYSDNVKNETINLINSIIINPS